MQIKCSFNGSKQAAAKFRAVGAGIDKAVGEYVKQSTKSIETMAQDFAAVNTGEMRNAITSTAEKTAMGWKGIIEAGGGLIYVEYGTGPRASMPSSNGQPKNPEDIPHTSKGKWFIPLSILSAQQISDMTSKYHFPKVTTDEGVELFVCRGQAPQPFMYPAAKYEFDDFKENFPVYLREKIRALIG